MRKIFLTIFSIGVMVFSINLTFGLAYQIEDLTAIPIENDFVLGPGKIELLVNSGDEYIRELLITNRLGRTMNFKIEIEDFKGSRNPQEVTILLGQERGPYSLKDYLKPEITEFVLAHGQRMILPIKISIPIDAEPGGLYGTVLVSAYSSLTPEEIEKEKTKGQISIISRLGTLFFIKVKGEVVENGFLKDFKTDKKFYGKGPISFELFFENNGNVHLTPYGIIEIYNLLGKKIEEIKLDPWFVLPDSLRMREMKWNKNFLFGRYTALASVNRGYQDIIDQKSIEFWVIPWKILLVGLIGLFLIIWFFVWIVKHFEIKRKR